MKDKCIFNILLPRVNIAVSTTKKVEIKHANFDFNFLFENFFLPSSLVI